jgi:ketosteroid isomerase-like protein
VSENLDLVRSIYADFERGDFSRSDWAHHEFEIVYVGGPEPGYSASGHGTGVAATAESLRVFLSAWEDYCSKADEFHELDDERVLVLVRRSGHGKRSGVDLEQIASEGAELYHLRDGKVTKQVVYFDRDRALADLGLE